MIDEYYTWEIFGYHAEDLSHGSNKRVVAMCDECGIYRTLRFVQYSDMCKKCSQKHCAVAKSKIQLAPKEPLPDGWEQKLDDITTNKECASYLGSIAEVILSNIYTDVRVMPTQNHGFDVICNRDFMIDIKSSATGDKGYWKFYINKNKIADYFLCLAFNNRDDLYNPVHLWMIPGHIVNHLSGAQINKSTIDKWRKYELPLDKLLMCCGNLKHNTKEVLE